MSHTPDLNINPLALSVTVFGNGIYKEVIMIIQWGGVSYQIELVPKRRREARVISASCKGNQRVATHKSRKDYFLETELAGASYLNSPAARNPENHDVLERVFPTSGSRIVWLCHMQLCPQEPPTFVVPCHSNHSTFTHHWMTIACLMLHLFNKQDAWKGIHVWWASATGVSTVEVGLRIHNQSVGTTSRY